MRLMFNVMFDMLVYELLKIGLVGWICNVSFVRICITFCFVCIYTLSLCMFYLYRCWHVSVCLVLCHFAINK